MAVWLMGAFDFHEAIPSLMELVEDKVASVRWAAILLLGRLNAQGAIPSLTKAFHLKDQDHSSKMVTLHALGTIGTAEAGEFLAKVAQDKTEHSEVRGQAVESISDLNDGKVYVPLLLELLRDESADVRFWAVFAMSHLGSAEHIPILEDIAQNDGGIVPKWGTLHNEARETIEIIRDRLEEDSIV
jgi:HEAT repeat protein